MKIGSVYLRDSYGYPVTTIEGFHPIVNPIRVLLHTSIAQTWKHRNLRTAMYPQKNSSVQAACADTAAFGPDIRVLRVDEITTRPEFDHAQWDTMSAAERQAAQDEVARRLNAAFEATNRKKD